jgi:hypothetical protein
MIDLRDQLAAYGKDLVTASELARHSERLEQRPTSPVANERRRRWAVAGSMVAVVAFVVGAINIDKIGGDRPPGDESQGEPQWLVDDDPLGQFVSDGSTGVMTLENGRTVRFGGAVLLTDVVSGPFGEVAVGIEDIGGSRIVRIYRHVDAGWKAVPYDQSKFENMDLIEAREQARNWQSGLMITAVAASDDVVVAVGHDDWEVGAGYAWASKDGTTWTRVVMPSTATAELYVDDIAFWQGRFVAVGRQATKPAGEDRPSDAIAVLWTSLDGVSWDQADLDQLDAPSPVVTPSRELSIATTGETLTILQHSFGTWVTDDLVDWTASPLSATTIAGSPSNGYIAIGVESVAMPEFTAGGLTFDSGSRLVAWTSPDGQTWVQRSLPQTGSRVQQAGPMSWGTLGWQGFATELQGERFVDVVIASPDGNEWTIERAPFEGYRLAIIGTPDGYLAVGQSGRPAVAALPRGGEEVEGDGEDASVWRLNVGEPEDQTDPPTPTAT